MTDDEKILAEPIIEKLMDSMWLLGILARNVEGEIDRRPLLTERLKAAEAATTAAGLSFAEVMVEAAYASAAAEQAASKQKFKRLRPERGTAASHCRIPV